MNSIILIQDQLLQEALPLLSEKRKEEQDNNIANSENSGISDTEEPQKKKGSLEERVTILSIAYHNLAVELEFLNQVSSL